MCQATFQNAGPLWFASSPGKETPILFITEENFAFAMNVIAQTAALFQNLRIIAFVVMDNHFHFVILCESVEIIREFYSAVKKRLQRRSPQIRPTELDIRPIVDLNSLRNRIAYTHRNGFVSNADCTPFSYRWGTGRYYFNEYPAGESLGEMKVRQRRVMFIGRDPQLPSAWKVVNAGAAHISPASFCDIGLGMAMFRDAHHYFAAVSKNVEAYSGIAVELDDGEFLTDHELFSQVLKIVREKYRLASTKELTGAQRLDLARTLHYDYRSSNGQIRRVLGLSQFEVDSLFPARK